jgi:hypothetical protein
MSNAPRTLVLHVAIACAATKPLARFSGSAFDTARSIDFQRCVNRIGISLQQHEK